MRFVYADTSVWNRLCDQNCDPRSLCSELANRDTVPVIGFNVLYEMGKLFVVGTSEATKRGQELLHYMKRYFSCQVPVVKENGPLLIEESMHATGQERMDSCFRNDIQYESTVQEIGKLCVGEVSADAERFFASRKYEAQTSRRMLKQQLKERPDITAALAKVCDEDLPGFLNAAVGAQLGQSLLLGHLAREWPKNSLDELTNVVRLLLQSPSCRLARTITRTDIYLLWRCARRGSLRSDLPDDCFHIVNAAYAHVFLTTEKDQGEIARHAIEGIQVLVFNQDEQIFDRLMGHLAL